MSFDSQEGSIEPLSNPLRRVSVGVGEGEDCLFIGCPIIGALGALVVRFPADFEAVGAICVLPAVSMPAV